MELRGRLVNTKFTKLQIRRAMRAQGQEAALDALLASNATFAADWADAQEIDLNDEVTQQALQSVNIDVMAIKKAIYGG